MGFAPWAPAENLTSHDTGCLEGFQNFTPVFSDDTCIRKQASAGFRV